MPRGVGKAASRENHLFSLGIEGPCCGGRPVQQESARLSSGSCSGPGSATAPRSPCPCSCSQFGLTPAPLFQAQFNAFVCLFVKVGGSESSPLPLMECQCLRWCFHLDLGLSVCVWEGVGEGERMSLQSAWADPVPKAAFWVMPSKHPFL